MKQRVFTILLGLFILTGCATLPPLQEMSNARQTISAAKGLSENAALGYIPCEAFFMRPSGLTRTRARFNDHRFFAFVRDCHLHVQVTGNFLDIMPRLRMQGEKLTTMTD